MQYVCVPTYVHTCICMYVHNYVVLRFCPGMTYIRIELYDNHDKSIIVINCFLVHYRDYNTIFIIMIIVNFRILYKLYKSASQLVSYFSQIHT